MPSTVILGTGIVGLSTAYYLSQLTSEDDTRANGTPETANKAQRHEIHLVEPSPELFASASGKAAGFLAKDWFAPAVASLGEFSFELHRKLAEEHGGSEKWGWSESTSYSLDRDDSASEGEDDVGEEETVAGAAAGQIPQSNGRAGHANGQPTNGSRTHQNDLGWLMSGSSRMTLLDDPAAGSASEEEEDDLPRWLRAKRSALQMVSDRTATGQVCVYHLSFPASARLRVVARRLRCQSRYDCNCNCTLNLSQH